MQTVGIVIIYIIMWSYNFSKIAQCLFVLLIVFVIKGRPGLCDGQAHHPPDPLPAKAHRERPPGPALAAGGHGGKL